MADDLDFSKINFGDDIPPNPVADPPPKTKTPRKSTSTSTNSRGVGRPTKQSKAKELEDDISGFLMLLAMPLKMRDIHYDPESEQYFSCGDLFVNLGPKGLELTPEAAQFAKALADVGVDNKFITAFFNMGEKGGKWLALVMAAQPLVMGIVSNHIGARRDNASVGSSPLA